MSSQDTQFGICEQCWQNWAGCCSCPRTSDLEQPPQGLPNDQSMADCLYPAFYTQQPQLEASWTSHDEPRISDARKEQAAGGERAASNLTMGQQAQILDMGNDPASDQLLFGLQAQRTYEDYSFTSFTESSGVGGNDQFAGGKSTVDPAALNGFHQEQYVDFSLESDTNGNQPAPSGFTDNNPYMGYPDWVPEPEPLAEYSQPAPLPPWTWEDGMLDLLDEPAAQPAQEPAAQPAQEPAVVPAADGPKRRGRPPGVKNSRPRKKPGQKAEERRLAEERGAIRRPGRPAGKTDTKVRAKAGQGRNYAYGARYRAQKKAEGKKRQGPDDDSNAPMC